MARSLYARAAQRGFPVADLGGQSGQGHLPDATAPPARAGLPGASWTDPNTDPASVPAALPPPEEYALGLSLWGLPAAPNPDDTPRTHAAPLADPVQLGAGEGTDLHGRVFTGVAERQPVTLATTQQGRDRGQGSSADTLQPLSGQIRANAGLDAVQGYGGGGPGPGGVNQPQGPTTDLTTWGGYTYSNVFVSAGEVPLVVPAAAQFIATAPELPPYAATYDAPTATVRAQGIAGADIPAQGGPVGAGLPAYLTSFWS